MIVDGFDNFTEVQIGLLKTLVGRVDSLVITLTGIPNASRPLVHRRFNQTRQRLAAALPVEPEPLPAEPAVGVPVLKHLEAGLFEPNPATIDGPQTVTLIESPDRAAEVRAALRWLKKQLIRDELELTEVALLARSIPPYRPFISQIAQEYGMPVRILEGEPLRSNPAIAALLDLLRLMLPRSAGDSEPGLSYRLVIEAWASPYFDWSAGLARDTEEPIGITTGDANALGVVARQGQVIGGYSQWLEALTILAARSKEETKDHGEALESTGLPGAAEIRSLLAKFERFVQRLTPPSEAKSYRKFVGWLEDLIGPDPAEAHRFGQAAQPETGTLKIVARAREAEATAVRDVAALQTLKEVLRGLVWAEQAINPDQVVDFGQFFADLNGAVEASHYTLPVDSARHELLVADVVQVRGVPFQAVAVLGLAEGEFPAVLSEDPLLRNTDRLKLRAMGLELDLPTDSAEVEFFYETITRPWDRLLLTRPRLADNGSLWQASPYWEEVRRLVNVQPEVLTSDISPAPAEAASWVELLESLSTYPDYAPVRAWLEQVQPARQTSLGTAAQLLTVRQAEATGNPYDGDLRALTAEWAERFGPEHRWSASRLESYRTCAFMFFVSSVLDLEPRAEPGEGLDARQLGNIYHRILEQLFQAVTDPGDLDELLETLPASATPILDEAPRREGFRATSWWAETRREIVENVRASLRELHETADGFVPFAYEQGFFGDQSLVVRTGADYFRLHGLIDRIDRNATGAIRLIDYKTAGPYNFTDKALREGKKVQLPLYALAARDALQFGEPVDGFYWHIQHAEPSSFTLKDFSDEQGQVGHEAAMQTAVDKAREAIQGARAGHFVPRPPEGGCPSYCPAAAFCWHYEPGFGG
jgi:ATP-dependent helicase/DNAse subunit B